MAEQRTDHSGPQPASAQPTSHDPGPEQNRASIDSQVVEPGIRLTDLALPLCFVTPGGDVAWANQAFRALASSSDTTSRQGGSGQGASSQGARLDALIDPSDRPSLALLMAGGVEVRFGCRASGGRRHELRVVAHGVPQTPGTGPPVLLAAIETEDWRADADLEVALRLELGHRFRNLITVIAALVNDTMADHADSASVARLLDRLRSLQTAGYVGNEVFHADCSVGRIARRILDRFHDPADRRVLLDGDDVAVSRRWGNILALVLHELATNCVKHGSLSLRTGTVMLRWCAIAQLDRTMLHIEWREIGGPPVHKPAQYGQGLTFVENVLGRIRDATVALRFAPTGLTCQIELPIERRRPS